MIGAAIGPLLKGTGALKALEIEVSSENLGSGRHIRELASWRSATRVLDPRFALVTRSFDIDRARTKIVSCVSDEQAQYPPR